MVRFLGKSLSFWFNDEVEVIQCRFNVPLVEPVANFRNSQLAGCIIFKFKFPQARKHMCLYFH